MPRPFKFKLSDQDGETPEFVGEFSDDEWAKLQRYCRFFDAVCDTRLVKGGMNYGFSFVWDAKTGHSIDTSRFPDPADVAEFLHRFRPIILHDEPTSFSKTLGIISQKAPHRGWRILSQQYSGKRFRKAVSLRMTAAPTGEEPPAAPVTINSANALQNWLNAYEYHHDEDLEAEFEKLDSPEYPGRDLIRGMMLEMLREKFIAAAQLRQIIRTFEQGTGASYVVK